jgi:tripartite ATP-independent transporter DctM subunit
MAKVSRIGGTLWRLESWIAASSLLALGVFPVIEALLRLLGSSGIPGYNAYLIHLVLISAFLGGMITAREERHLAIRVAVDAMSGRARAITENSTMFLSVTIVTAFFWSAVSFLIVGFEPGQLAGAVPVRAFAAVIPIAYLVIAGRFVIRAGVGSLWISIAAIIVGTFVGYEAMFNAVLFLAQRVPPFLDSFFGVWLSVLPILAPILIILLVAGALLGVPLFVALGGVALLLFARYGGSTAVVANESYVVLTGATVPAIPLFTLVGFFLSESKAGERLVRLFRAFFGWLPGGVYVAAILASTFFTTFTGASGVTIVALGGLLLLVLVGDKERDQQFSVGLLTGSGSIGLLFPPSLALIVYGSVAGVSIRDLFVGGILPGAALVFAMCGIGIWFSVTRKIPSIPFDLHEAGQALLDAIWEVLLPAVVVLLYFSGAATLTETAALAVVYTLIVEVVIRRELSGRKLLAVLLRALSIVGGVLLILALARALSYYIVDSQIPQQLTVWVEQTIRSRLLFLLLLNIALLVAGMFMDVFGAILIVAPLVIPTAGVFGIDPVHLGIVFVANMGIGFITPPVGVNLFLASYRFNVPLVRVYRAVVPFFVLQLLIVLLITYVPWLTTAFLG